MRQIILDTETTGLDPNDGHRIIEIGCVEMIDRRITGNNYHQYIHPEREIDTGAAKVHGITLSALQDKPKFGEIIQEFFNFIDGAELIIHNAPFDLKFLNAEFRLQGKKWGKVENHCSIIDTLVMARNTFPGQRNNLDALCKRFQVDNSNRELHGALLDSELLGFVYLAMTGGQDDMFAENEKSDKDSNQESSAPIVHQAIEKTEGLVVIHADDNELKAHQDSLSKLAKQSEVIWPS